jgi:hypothetical protein
LDECQRFVPNFSHVPPKFLLFRKILHATFM